MSSTTKIAIICTVGIVGAGIIGYCIYFDRKRRSHPDYKKNVLKRRKPTRQANGTMKNVVDLRDPEARDQFVAGEFENANQKLMEGNVEDAVGHFINFVQFSGNPKGSLQMLGQLLPPAIFNLIIQTFAAIAKNQGQGGTAVGNSVEVD